MILLFDGAFGTEFQRISKKRYINIEEANISDKEVVASIHEEYVKAGADVITTNTFSCLNMLYQGNTESITYLNEGLSLIPKGKKIALSIGPVSSLMSPVGECDKDKLTQSAELLFSSIEHKFDFLLLETFQDILQLKLVILAAKKILKDVKIIASMTFDKSCRTLTGSTPEIVALTLSRLGVYAVGVNCSFGPENVLEVIKRMIPLSESAEFYVSPNRSVPGQPELTDSVYSSYTRDFIKLGIKLIGGCCGSTPNTTSISRKIIDHGHIHVDPPKFDKNQYLCSESRLLKVEKGLIVGERINPTGKKALKQALLDRNYDYIVSLAISQVSEGANILDVNVGVPGLVEEEVLPEVVEKLQEAVSVPLMIDSVSPAAIEAALRVYRGVPIVNSVNASDESINSILPIISKYGTMLVCLPFDTEIPEKVLERLYLSDKIIRASSKLGISLSRLVFDLLISPVTVNSAYLKTSFFYLKELSLKGIKSIAGISNCSFGMQNRETVNFVLQTKLQNKGLTFAIVNPCSSISKQFREAEASLFSTNTKVITGFSKQESPIKYCLLQGIQIDSVPEAKDELSKMSKEDLIKLVLSTVSEVSELFNKGEIYLSSLVKTAEIASSVLSKINTSESSGLKVLIATVKGDFHDIGKNIVKAVLSANNISVIDLGKNVSKEQILKAYTEEISAIGLSALLSVSVIEMKETISFLKENKVTCPIIVGGAVLSESVAEDINADFYAEDATTTANIVLSLK